MINVLIPSMGGNLFFENSYFPKSLIEISGRTMLEIVMDNFNSLKERQMIYVFSQDECNQFHIDSSVKILDENAKVLALKQQTAGALCTALIALEFIDNEQPLLIVNSDQVIDVDYKEVCDYFNENNADAGVITFPSIHPRWSYIDLEKEEVIEVAEKRPLSQHAIAGFYYFRRGKDFVEAAKKAVLKQNCVDGKYYISASLNELILMGKSVQCYSITNEQYHSFYSPEKIREYEREKE